MMLRFMNRLSADPQQRSSRGDRPAVEDRASQLSIGERFDRAGEQIAGNADLGRQRRSIVRRVHPGIDPDLDVHLLRNRVVLRQAEHDSITQVEQDVTDVPLYSSADQFPGARAT